MSFLDESTVRIEDVRDFVWEGERSKKSAWITRTITPEDIVRAHVVCEQFRSWGASHIFICFETVLDPICISIEARRKQGQAYSIFKGLWGAYEIIYQYGSARDMIGKRLERGRDLDVCTLKLSKQAAWDVFASLARAAERNAHDPERYQTIKRNCVTELFKHLPGSPRAPLIPRDTGPLLVSLDLSEPCDIFDKEYPPPFLHNP